MAANKTEQTDADVETFLEGVVDPAQRADAEKLIAMMSAASGHPSKMWGPSIIGFGSHHYRYESGREGDTPRIAFSPRKGKTVLYGLVGASDAEALRERLGKHSAGKGCLYIKRLNDIDMTVLGELVNAALSRRNANI